MTNQKKFGDNSVAYPPEMRTQLWPLCCGAKIISGFKDVGSLTKDELVKQIEDVCDNYIADHQVYASENIIPRLTFLTLNDQQYGSDKIRSAVREVGFIEFAVAKPRNKPQYFFMRDLSRSFKLVPLENAEQPVVAVPEVV